MTQMLIDMLKYDPIKSSRMAIQIYIKYYKEELFQQVLKQNFIRMICKDKETFINTEEGPYKTSIPGVISKDRPRVNNGVVYLAYITVGDKCHIYPGINRDREWERNGIASNGHLGELDTTALGIFKRKLDGDGIKYKQQSNR